MLEIVDSNQYGSYLVELMEMFRSEWSDLEPFTTEINGYPIPRPLLAINDGKLPSNVGGGYNLRAIFRRAISFIDKFNWNIDMADVCEWHAEELEGIFPEGRCV